MDIGYRIYISYGEGRITDFDYSKAIQIADITNQWVKEEYHTSFDLINDEIINLTSQSGAYPDWADDTILFDTKLEINMLGDFSKGSQIGDYLSEEGLIRLEEIEIEQKQDFVNQGYTPILTERTPLLKKGLYDS